MIRIPSQDAIDVAERRLDHARQNTRSGLARARLRFREKLSQPASIAMLAGAAGLLAFWLAPRSKGKRPAAAARPGAFRSHPILLALAEVSIRALPFAMWRLRSTQAKRGSGSPSAVQAGSPRSPV